MTRQLFVTGATIGPFMDGLHNQCLLQYKIAPVILDVPNNNMMGWWNNDPLKENAAAAAETITSHLFTSSWLIPPLLGIAYIILGGIVPRILQNIITLLQERMVDVVSTTTSTTTNNNNNNHHLSSSSSSIRTTPQQRPRPPSLFVLGFKAVIAVLSTAMILLISKYLILHPHENHYGMIDNTAVFESSDSLEQHLLILMTAAITQWAYLDGTLVAFLTACLSSVLGPLSELPFIAHHVWEYLPEASDLYVPLQNVERTSIPGQFLQSVLGEDYNTLALNGVTGPCYFAVTMDAIAIGRFLTRMEETNIQNNNNGSSSSSNSRHRNENLDEISENRVFIASSRGEQTPRTSSTIPPEVNDKDIPEESINPMTTTRRNDLSNK